MAPQTLTRPVDEQQITEVAQKIVEAIATYVPTTLEFRVWQEIESRRSKPVFRFANKMVKSGVPLHRFIEEYGLIGNPELRQQYLDLQQQITSNTVNGGNGHTAQNRH